MNLISCFSKLMSLLYIYLRFPLFQQVQVAFIAKQWVDHTLGKARDPNAKKHATKKAQAEAEQRGKDTLFHLVEVENHRKNAEFALTGYEKQAAKALEAQKKAKSQLALAMIQVKQQQQQLEAKDAEKAKAEQVAYDMGMTKITQSLTGQL